MSIQTIYQRIAGSRFFNEVHDWCHTAAPTDALRLNGVVGSLPAFVLRRLVQDLDRPLLCLLADEDQAAYLYSDLEQLLGETSRLLRLPASGHTPYDDEQISELTPIVERSDVLQRLTDGFAGVLVASVDAVFEMLPPPTTVTQETIVLNIGDEIAPNDLVKRLMAQGFERVEFVEQPGELALRGGILDVFPFSGIYPIRIEFFGDEIDSLREFDARSQRSVSRLKTTRLVPNLERDTQPGTHFTPIFDYLPAEMLLATFDEAQLVEKAEARFDAAATAFASLDNPDEHTAPADRYLDGAAFERALLHHTRLLLGTFTGAGAAESLSLDARPQPDFNRNISLLREQVRRNTAEHITTFILCDSRGQENRLRELLEDELASQQLNLSVESLHEGFELPSMGTAVYTDHQIFNRYHRPTARKRKQQYGGLNLREIQNLTPGDFVVHIDYGIGKFAGLHKITVRGKQQEAVKVLFQGEDVLYVNVNALYKLHKYSGKEGHQPRLTKLGSGQWEKTKARTKKRVKDIARDLIKLYARRKASKGYAFPGDTIWQREMEASFEFEDTPDQASASAAVKEDMEEAVPMDRLVCGDVGFGKTEIAVRAAFKAVQDGKQVAILVPTTILAAQHTDTFTKRLANFPVRIEELSRFRTADEQKEVVAKVKTGEVDILIGTHRIASKDVQFKNLGLLIIDEEQRFGVAVKEKLRKLRVNVDTLTLTATPIPRTLQFSLLGARDLSIIATPPPNRQPIVTEIHTFDKDLIRDAILYETSRGGQVFFIHNRVQSIDEMADTIRMLVPDVRARVAHGQMRPSQLEQVMHDFIERKFEVLVSTNIIESGLDISNANTIIINRADRFGLAELHQLRGRVGRSDRKAFCYLLVPSIHSLTREGRQRLQAVEEFSDLGSGFNIAMRDLDIRGAGNLLGAEQSGFIEDVGFETYHKILDEAVRELREEEFADVFQGEPHAPAPAETQVDVEEDAFIPETYLSNHVERLNIYRRLSDAASDEALAEMQTELEDRFGAVPPEVVTLIAAMRIKLQAQALRLTKATFKNQRLFLTMPSQEEDAYFYEHRFHPLLEKLSGLDRRFVLRDTKSKRVRAIVQDVPDLSTALTVMGHLTAESVPAG